LLGIAHRDPAIAPTWARSLRESRARRAPSRALGRRGAALLDRARSARHKARVREFRDGLIATTIATRT